MNEIPPGPFDKDVLEKNSKNTPLSEKDFIQESPEPPKVKGLPLWIWLALLTIAIALGWGSLGWLQEITQKELQSRPFLDVSNRKFSTFLWQFPIFMRSYAKQKTGYLPGFQYGDRFTLDPTAANQLVAAPPGLLFLYHTWDRLLANDFIARPIPSNEFKEFINQAQEWLPSNWKEAPSEYVTLINSQHYTTIPDLQTLPQTTLPLTIRQAFQGWKNYLKEGVEINALSVTVEQMQQFLKEHPHYARNYWRNIQTIEEKEVAGSHYLELLDQSNLDSQTVIPSDQISAFLKVAFYNAQQAAKGL